MSVLIFQEVMRKSCSRRSLGLVVHEVIILTLVPTVFVALLLPAVHAARESARRMQCSNNLKQMGYAMHNFSESHISFPPGASQSLSSASSQTTYGVTSLFAFGAHLLPDLELSMVFHKLAEHDATFNQLFQNSEVNECLATQFALQRCASDSSSPRLNIGRAFEVEDSVLRSIALSNYVANNGSAELRAEVGHVNGLFGVGRGFRFSEIVDGASNTVALGERAWKFHKRRETYNSRASLFLGIRGARDRSFYGVADSMASGRYRINFDAIDQPNGLGQSYLRRGYSSNHQGGAQFLFADGSARYIPETIDFDCDDTTQIAISEAVDSVWEKILCRNDGGVVDLDSL